MKKRLPIEAVKNVVRNPPIKDAAWDFSVCPHPAQTEACYLFEYSREADAVKMEMAETRAKMAWRNAHEPEIAAWLEANPCPVQRAERDAWLKRAPELFPHIVVTTELQSDLHFLLGCSFFPEQHWMEMPRQQRDEIAKRLHPERYRFYGSFAEIALIPLHIQPLQEFDEFRSTSALYVSRQLAGESGYQVFSLFWARSDRKLIHDFKLWLEENRPKNQPGVEHTKESASRRTNPKDYLKALSALRLLKAFRGDFEGARTHAFERLDKMLYKDQSAWLKAARRAEQEITHFQLRMLRQPPSVG